MRVISKRKVAVFFGLLVHGSFSLAQSLLPGDPAPDYRPVGTLVFRQNNSMLPGEPSRAAIHAAYVLYISTLQGVLLDTNPERVEQQAAILEIAPEDIERVHLVLNEFNTRLSTSRRAMLEGECAPLLADMPMANAEVEAAVARIDSDEPREQILQDVLQSIRDTFGDEVVLRIQKRVNEIGRSGQLARLQQLEQMVRVQSGGELAYLNEQCAALKE